MFLRMLVAWARVSPNRSRVPAFALASATPGTVPLVHTQVRFGGITTPLEMAEVGAP